MKILVIENDALLSQGLILVMQSEGYVCGGVSTAHETTLSLASNHYSLIVLDLNLPDGGGLYFLTRMRREKITQPVLILTAHDMLEDRINGLDTGVDDYLVKPLALKELNARIRVLLRRHDNQGDNEISVSDLRLNVTRCLVWLGETTLESTPEEYVLLLRLMMKAGSPVHREILYNDTYSWDNEPTTNTLEVHIHNPRERIDRSWIHTVRGFGYMPTNHIDTEQTMALFATEIWTMHHRSLLTIDAILVVRQLVSIFWLWHESKKQIQLLAASAIEGHNNQRHAEHEVREAVVSLLVPSLLIVGLALYISMPTTRKIIRPPSRLQNELGGHTPDSLAPIMFSKSVPEVTTVTTALDQLISRPNLTFDRERLFTAGVARGLHIPLADPWLHPELPVKVRGVGVDSPIQRLDQMAINISQLLQLTRIGQSLSADSYQQVLLLGDVTKPLQDELETTLAQRQQQLPLTDVESETIVSNDAMSIRVISCNLVENAHRYSPEGSTIRVSVKADLVPVMTVGNEGPGIDEAKSGELSEAFVRIDSYYGGVGLGLSIVIRIAQLHGAQFSPYNRQPGPGVRAWVLFPRRAGQNISTH